MKPKIYLAGPISGITFGEGLTWRQEAETLLGDDITPLCPFRGKHGYFSKDQVLGNVQIDSVPLISDHGIFRRDTNDLEQCSGVIANFQGSAVVSIGTVFELGYAFRARKPIVAVLDERHDHAFLREAATYVVPNLQQACALMRHILGV